MPPTPMSISFAPPRQLPELPATSREPFATIPICAAAAAYALAAAIIWPYVIGHRLAGAGEATLAIRLLLTLFPPVAAFAAAATAWSWRTRKRLRHLTGETHRRHRAERALRVADARWHSLLDSVREIVFETDDQGRWTLLSPSWREVTGYDPAECIGTPFTDFLHEDDREASRAAFQLLVERRKDFCRHEARYVARDGGIRRIEVRARLLLDDAGAPAGAFGTLTDVTEQRQAESVALEGEERLRLALMAANLAVWECDPSTDDVLVLHPDHVAGLGQSVLNRQTLLGQIHADDRARVLAEYAQALERCGEFACEYRSIQANDTVRWRHDRGRALPDASGRARRIVGVSVDVTERKLLEEQLTVQAFRDELTGLANRALLVSRAEEEIRRLAVDGGGLAVAFIDLDNFKAANDGFGHVVGDRLLRAVSARIHDSVRPGDLCARLGGDEFAILMADTDAEQAVEVATRVLAALEHPVPVGGIPVMTGASVGVAIHRAGWSCEGLLRNADVAMYRAKAEGKGRLALFSDEMLAAVRERVALETDLRRLLDGGDGVGTLELHYQPIVDLIDERVTGVEALVRWRHPQRGLVPPLEFIPVAEDTGLIVPLGRWVLREACQQLASWCREPGVDEGLTITVNLSGRQLLHPGLVDDVESTLQQTGLPAHRLLLELTESVLLDDAPVLTESLRSLRRLGVRLAIDDFGTGYSSLAYLQRFPMDVLKIDRAFVHELDVGDGELPLARAVVSLGQALGLRVVAEGIENAQQCALLRAMGCGHGQGFFFARPLDTEAATAFLTTRSAAVRLRESA